MLAADPPAIVAPSGQDQDVIEVVATRSDQAQRIDRRTYRVRETPHSAQADSLQLLRGLPAVTITPDDQIMLLGAAGVTILVDERPVRGDPIQYLRTLHGSDIERIEIITNPSAQYSAQGTGGIINFVLRHKKTDGTTGSGSVEVKSLGHFEGVGSFKKKTGKWTYELNMQARAGQYSRTSYHKLRTVEIVPGLPTVNTEDGDGSSHASAAWANPRVTYEIDSKTNISAELFGGGAVNDSRTEIDYVGLTPDFESFSESQRWSESTSFVGTAIALDHKGKTEGETLKASADLFGNPKNNQRRTSAFGDDSGFVSERRNELLFANAKVDWVHPIGKDRILSMGAAWEFEHDKRSYAFASTGDDALFGPDFEDRFSADQGKIAAYATFQKTFGKWTLMPGLRLERMEREIKSPGLPTSNVTRTDLFPSFHLEHPFSKTLNLTLSYSKRIDRPYLDLLRPFGIITGPLAIDFGNPDLKDQSTDSYELNLHYSRKKLEIGLIVYDRETDGLWNTSYFVNPEGQNVGTMINAGHKSDRGAQFDVSTPLLKRVKGTASVNLFSTRVPIDPVNSSDSDTMFRYTGNATIEWRGKDKDKKPGDIAQLQLTYESPSRDFQIHRDGHYSLNLSWTHSFSQRFSMTASAENIGPRHYRHELIAPTVQELYDRRETQPIFKLKLVQTLGSTPK